MIANENNDFCDSKNSCRLVECLGKIFQNQTERREYFLKILAEKLKDPEFRKKEDFPSGNDEDVLFLSDPPYYTACPNPFISDFIKFYGKIYNPDEDNYKKEPFTIDVVAGKNEAIYRLPSYHTKVPPKAIKEYILHYTNPGDIVLDAFCGTGMTGVACLQLDTIDKLPEENSNIGKRHAILIDISPTATFIASILNSPLLPELAMGAKSNLAKIINEEIYPLYNSMWGQKIQPFDYAVWSDWGVCKECGESFRLYDSVVDYDHQKMLDEYNCPNCRALLRSNSQKKAFSTIFDPWLGKPINIAKTTMVLLSHKVGNRAIRRDATKEDIDLADEIGNNPLSKVPIELPYSHMTHERNNLPVYWGITHIHHFYTRRNFYALSKLASIPDPQARKAALFAVLAVHENNLTRRNRFYIDPRRPHGSPIGPLSNTLYVPTLQVEVNIGKKITSVLDEIQKLKNAWPVSYSMVSTQSATDLKQIPDNSIDFIFTDPPFGGNINYSEQNILTEYLLKVFTNNKEEAIINTVQKKGLVEYQEIMESCFREYCRVLKPGRWMVVEFHNSANAIWISIQHALESAGFVVAAVAILDKIQTTLHQDLNKNSTVNKDLAITVYKPNGGLEERFRIKAGTEEGVWDFVRTHLRQISGFGSIERQNRLLFDRVVAFHLRRGVTIPISASEFYAGLSERFPERDGMYFLPEQAAEYDKNMMKSKEMLQLQLFVTDEASAIEWLRQQLSRKPQTYQEIQPNFMKASSGWSKNETRIDLKELLEQNFLNFEGDGEVPSQIHSYLSSNFKDLRNLSKTDLDLIEKSKDRWYIPDPRKAIDLERLRERALLKEFHLITESKKRLKEFRIEAVRVGFKKCYDEGNYKTILEIANKLPSNIVAEDSWLLMYTDLARSRQL